MAGSDQDSMGQFFDFGGITEPEAMDSHLALSNDPQLEPAEGDLLPDLSNAVSTYISNCSVHPYEACLCDKIIADFGLDEPDCDTSLQPENYANFKAWIPRYSKPDRACDYCRSKGLECFFTYEGQHFCSPCNALFRQCSFATNKTRPNVVMDTLHTVAEDQVQEQGALTGITAMKSWDRAGFDYLDEEHDRPSRKTGTRFPRAAVKVLKDWMDAHADHPYPTEQEKEDLQALTGLKATQITNWMANTRRRRKTRNRGVSPSIRSPTWPTGSDAIDVPFDKKSIRHNGKTWDFMNPLERWQHSPPENEPARIPDIVDAVEKTKSSRTDSYSSFSSSAGARPGFLSSAGSSSSLVQHRAPSVTSLGTGQSDSFGSLLSSGSLGSSLSQNSRNSFGSSRTKDRRRRRRTAANPSKSKRVQETRPFQCTFCTDRFRTKYDWARHEKSLHLSLEKWMCAPLGPVWTGPSGQEQCVYCGENDPTEEHIETHNHKACEEKGRDARTFYRKDHLRQHLRLVHGCKMLETMDNWKSEAVYIKSRCGFCKQEFTRWQDRIDHIAKHFRAGAQMKDWKGCRGLDPAVAAQVTNAMPPYLIGNESLSPFPFSASNEATWGQLRLTVGPGNDLEYTMSDGPNWESLIGPESMQEVVSTMPDFDGMFASTAPATCDALAMEPLYKTMDHSLSHRSPTRSNQGALTCWEILTVRLGQYAREQMAMGIIPTDEMLQSKARRILYEDDDTWNQTAADNSEWLELFKKAHGMPSTATDVRVDFDEDLGARIGELNFDGLMFDNNATGWDLAQQQSMAMTVDGVVNKFAVPATMAGSLGATFGTSIPDAS
ncbi:uncharacterized protein PV09_04965 [Verruconis gallopava]|uniref:Homeobox domain-containing protein n=1 Tax=Verruconis gallopava TaxID=253628 RepID=A0A0D2ABG8_9PEZI|nr:uncharacterized protein PV09_04965 [Verruconis gallopava]KIW04158.1 hypothetical protein PV09_04965 [Verruconis gallopava]